VGTAAETLMRPGAPFDSIRLAKFIVAPPRVVTELLLSDDTRAQRPHVNANPDPPSGRTGKAAGNADDFVGGGAKPHRPAPHEAGELRQAFVDDMPHQILKVKKERDGHPRR
jgi:hypothetical protein